MTFNTSKVWIMASNRFWVCWQMNFWDFSQWLKLMWISKWNHLQAGLQHSKEHKPFPKLETKGKLTLFQLYCIWCSWLFLAKLLIRISTYLILFSYNWAWAWPEEWLNGSVCSEQQGSSFMESLNHRARPISKVVIEMKKTLHRNCLLLASIKLNILP